MQAGKKRVFTIPSGTAFLPALVRSILEGRMFTSTSGTPDALELSRWTLLLPTRRAVRACREVFFELEPDCARLLPVIRALGDVDEDELHITGAYGAGAEAELNLPPAASPVQRQFMLANLISEWAQVHPDGPAGQAVNNSISHALHMATSLMQLIDALETGSLKLDDVAEKLQADPDLPMHRSEALAFLGLICEQYPQAMKRAGFIGPQARRSLLLLAESDRLKNAKTAGPVIAAGSTGSIPATATLLATIASLPQGAVVLPGLDTILDDESWAAIDETPQHPQYGMRELLNKMGVERSDVAVIPGLEEHPESHARALLASQLMRPSSMTHLWKDLASLKPDLELACTGLSELVCPEQREQALMIALIMRRAHDEDRACSLITPDRNLARRVSAELSRWNIHVDDSAGEPLTRLPQGMFFRLIGELCSNPLRLHNLIAVLNHALIGTAFAGFEETRKLAQRLEIAVLRQVPSATSLSALPTQVMSAQAQAGKDFAHPMAKKLSPEQWHELSRFVDVLLEMLSPLSCLAENQNRQPLTGFLHAHISVAEMLSNGADDVSDRLWTGEAGSALSDMFRDLLDHAALAPAMTFDDYLEYIISAMSAVSVRRRYPLHPKLRILGLLEARLVQSEQVILGGLNEGSWPGDADPGPWLSRPQHALVGLQMPERRLGLAAHDFVQGLGANRVFMTWARKIGGTPAIPSRWLRRLKAVLEAAGLPDTITPRHGENWGGWALGLDWHKDLTDDQKPAAAKPPCPLPPIEARPRRYSVSRIEKLQRDPYQVYANAILKLKPLEALDRAPGAAERGQLVHSILENFTRAYPGPFPDNAGEILRNSAITITSQQVHDPALRALWLPQIFRMTDWFCELEKDLRHDVLAQIVESEGSVSFRHNDQLITITARADRIDQLDDGQLRIIDYKTGGAKLQGDATKGYKPQLFLEGWIAQSGGFERVSPSQVKSLAYIHLSGGDPPGEMNSGSAKMDIAEEIEHAAEGAQKLVSGYLETSQGFPAKAGQEAWKRKSDYDHLSRWREWGLGVDDSSSEDEGE